MELEKSTGISKMAAGFIRFLIEKALKRLKITIVGEKSTLKFQLWYEDTLISEDFLIISSLNFENPTKTGKNIH